MSPSKLTGIFGWIQYHAYPEPVEARNILPFKLVVIKSDINGMSKFVMITGARAQEMINIFKLLQRISRANLPYPKDSKMAANYCVKSLNRGAGPAFRNFPGTFLPFILPFAPNL